MVFSSLVFIFAFLPFVLALYYALPSRPWRNVVLLAVSLAFYAWGEPVYIFLMVFSIIINWGFAVFIGQAVSKGKRQAARFFLITAVGVNLLLLGYFKYAGFIVDNLNLLTELNINPPRHSLPIGISFYTFLAISYVADVYRSEVKAQKNPLYFGTYMTMYPHLIAGPIVRYSTIEEELVHRHENLADFAEGIRIFIIGLGKKALIANVMAQVADKVLSFPASQYGVMESWYAVIAYTFQIYFDFSGYSDMATGLARMLGFHFLKNFDYPYISRSITEFWRRWHISLSSFFRDYVYIPLGGNRVPRGRWLLNILVVWFLTGLWHGASWNFIIWGLYFGILLIIEKFFLQQLLAKVPPVAAHVYTAFFFVLGWAIFRVEDISTLWELILTMFGANGLSGARSLVSMNVLQFWPWFIVASVGSTPVVSKLMNAAKRNRYASWASDAALLAIFGLSVLSLVTGSFNPFIYFRF